MPRVVVASPKLVTLEDDVREPLVVPVARCLLLLDAARRRRPEGCTLGELARLDFLLRHPLVLYRAIEDAGGAIEPALAPTESERIVTERAVLTVRLTASDDRYRMVAGRLVGCGLARLATSGTAPTLAIIDAGRHLAASLAEGRWKRVAARARAAVRYVDLDSAALERLVRQLLAT